MHRTLCAVALLTFTAVAQVRLRDVKTVFVDSFGNAEGAEMIREKVIHRLVKSGKIDVVEVADQADAILTGIGEVSKGVRYSASSGQYGGSASGGTRYDATLAVRLVDKNRKILWVAESKPGFLPSSVSSSVADKVVKDLMKAIAKDTK